MGSVTGKSIVDKENQTLGLKKRFCFEKSNTSKDGGWILHEYSLHISLINNASDNNYVLCKFRKNLKPNPQNKGKRIDHQSNSHLMNSIGQDSQGKTENNVWRKFVHEETKSQLNGGHKRRKVGNTWPEKTVVLGLKAITNIENNDSGNIKIDLVKSANTTEEKSNKEDGDRIINKDEDGDISWPEFFARQLLEGNEGSLIEEEDIEMIPNSGKHCYV
ncbi:hypothetical protein MTR_1g019820 [Medicago truncatula]|uniref:NAC domain-containing protein n=1 Tax=Medicago truncatula TaxID=3880 RepID=G7I4G0_MEDTR|nr:hypothetical protein MTR_1g019820 [Medicago truncatula]